MGKVEDGGAAFPGGSSTTKDGMALRDWLATIATEEDVQSFWLRGGGRAEAKYAYADAMLRARKSTYNAKP